MFLEVICRIYNIKNNFCNKICYKVATTVVNFLSPRYYLKT